MERNADESPLARSPESGDEFEAVLRRHRRAHDERHVARLVRLRVPGDVHAAPATLVEAQQLVLFAHVPVRRLALQLRGEDVNPAGRNAASLRGGVCGRVWRGLTPMLSEPRSPVAPPLALLGHERRIDGPETVRVKRRGLEGLVQLIGLRVPHGRRGPAGQPSTVGYAQLVHSHDGQADTPPLACGPGVLQSPVCTGCAARPRPESRRVSARPSSTHALGSRCRPCRPTAGQGAPAHERLGVVLSVSFA